jgi:sulfite reductase (ferredoxin)
VPDAIERLLRHYLLVREPGENVRQFFARHSSEEIRSFLAGALVPAEARDLATLSTPHGVEG